MWFYKDKVKKITATHTDCPSCEHYPNDCFPLLYIWHRITGRCRVGRKAPVRVKYKDQKTLDEVKGEL